MNRSPRDLFIEWPVRACGASSRAGWRKDFYLKYFIVGCHLMSAMRDPMMYTLPAYNILLLLLHSAAFKNLYVKSHSKGRLLLDGIS